MAGKQYASKQVVERLEQEITNLQTAVARLNELMVEGRTEMLEMRMTGPLREATPRRSW